MRDVTKTVKWFGLAAAMAFVGCSSAPANEEVSSELKASGCTVGAAYGSGCPSPPPNLDIPMNGLATTALVANLLAANADNSAVFVKSPLTAATFKAIPELRDALRDPATRQFLRYTLRCAMVPSQSFRLDGVDPATKLPWKIDETGRVGACPEWALASADAACQARVSACLLAENNPYGVHNAISIRGTLEQGIEPMRPRVPVVTSPRADSGKEGTDVMASFLPCASGTTGLAADCGWNPLPTYGYVGTCKPGTTVSVGTGGANPSACGGAHLGASPVNTVLRVCDGISGCTGDSAIASNDDACGLQSFVSFTCPAAELGASYGAFSVMVANYNRGEPLEARVEVSGGLKYPAPEVDVFRLREGAFFGNIFDRTALTISYTWDAVNNQLVPHALRRPTGQFRAQYQNLFACDDPKFPKATANILKRVCAQNDPSNCAASPVGDCNTVCQAPDASGGWGSCVAKNAVTNVLARYPSLTTYLHSTLDVLPNGP